MNTRILHISDLHFKDTDKAFYRDKANAIIDAYKQENKNKKIDYICVTGDIFNITVTSDVVNNEIKVKTIIKNAKDFFKRLCDELLEESDNNFDYRNKILFVPGNHELVLEYKAYDKLSVDKNYKFKAYHDFLNEFYKDENKDENEDCDKIINIEYEMNEIDDKKVYNVPNDKESFYFGNYNLLLRDEAKKVIFIGLNTIDSHNVDGKKELVHRIYENDLYIIRDLLQNILSSKSYKIVVLMHTHFFTVEERRRKVADKSTLVNADSLFDALKDYNLQLILHGHKHANLSRRYITSALHEKERIITVSAVGSSTKEDVSYNQFNVIEICNALENREFIFSEFIQDDTCIYNKTLSLELPSRNIYTFCEIEDILSLNVEYNNFLKNIVYNKEHLRKLLFILNPFCNIDTIKTDIRYLFYLIY